MYKTHYPVCRNWYRKIKRIKNNEKMTKPKWTLKWMFVSVLIIKIIAISANDNTHYLPPLECYDPYGRPQVRTLIKLRKFTFTRS